MGRPGSEIAPSSAQIEELHHVLVIELLGLWVVEGEAKLVNDFGAHGNPFAPAVGADLLKNLAALGIGEGRLRKLAGDAVAAGALDFALAQRAIRRAALELRDGRAQFLKHGSHFV